MRTRALKKRLEALLASGSEAFAAAIAEINALPARQAVNPLIGFYCHRDALVRWRAITATGMLVARLADTDMESARVIVRRLMWSLNDESGGIGWGAPEAMGDLMARHAKLAEEYACILVSYLNEAGNYLELPALQAGALWGVGRMAHARAELVADAAAHLPPFLTSPAPPHRGLAIWTAGGLRAFTLKPLIQPLVGDTMPFEFYNGQDLIPRTVGQMAADALAQIDAAVPNQQ